MRYRSFSKLLLSTVVLGGASALALPADAAEFAIDRSKVHQTMEGFGFFGGANVWWGSKESVNNPEWAQFVVDDLGITMWRNEYFPAEVPGAPQDATWEKQRPVVESLALAAKKSSVPLKMIITAWTPPANLKCLTNGSPDWATCSQPLTRPSDTKGGNILDPGKYSEFAEWLSNGVELYKDAGIDLYAISFQNEPLFSQSFNSCFYSQGGYADTLAAVGPVLKAAHPSLKIFGSENMLGIECGAGPSKDQFDSYFYTAAILNNPTALGSLDAFAVHGYNDGVVATESSLLARLWNSFQGGTSSSGKQIWMTETSGYKHDWEVAEGSGALDLGQAIYAALRHGNASAWVYWQGSDDSGLGEYNLMQGLLPGKNYYVSKQFYRYIRPGARRVELESDDESVLAVAFEHDAMGSFTIVALNTSDSEKTLTLSGSEIPPSFRAIRTSASENAVDLGEVYAGSLTLSASSITTFVSGNVYESEAPMVGTGGSPGSGGAIGNGSSDTGGTSSGGSLGGASDGDNGLPEKGEPSGCGCSVPANGINAGGALFATFTGLIALLQRRSVSARRRIR